MKNLFYLPLILLCASAVILRSSRSAVWLRVLLILALLGPGSLRETFAADKPNVVYIMADDIGWGDLSKNGGGVPTPNIDKLFSKGVELTQFMGRCRPASDCDR